MLNSDLAGFGCVREKIINLILDFGYELELEEIRPIQDQAVGDDPVGPHCSFARIHIRLGSTRNVGPGGQSIVRRKIRGVDDFAGDPVFLGPQDIVHEDI